MVKVLVLLLSLAVSAISAVAEPYCQVCPLSCNDLGLGRKDCSELRPARGLCCVDLTERGLDIAREQERALKTNPPPRAATCPSGYTPSERSCSKEERRRGCTDRRQPDGTGCVDSRFR